jgi:hypothetical protein
VGFVDEHAGIGSLGLGVGYPAPLMSLADGSEVGAGGGEQAGSVGWPGKPRILWILSAELGVIRQMALFVADFFMFRLHGDCYTAFIGKR